MSLQKFAFTKTDGRAWIQYHRRVEPKPLMIDEGLVRPGDWQAPELRYNRMRDEYLAVSASRNNRPFLPPAQYCPLCPVQEYQLDPNGVACKTYVPIMSRTYEWAVFENMFPGLAAEGSSGHCEVILYSADHSQTLGGCSLEHIEGVIEVWQDRSREIGALAHVQQVFLFENKGTEVGVTLHHPHGQLYAFHHQPPFIAKEMQAAERFYREKGQCLICAIAAKELDGPRLVARTEDLLVSVPQAARYPYEVHITTLQHLPLIEQLTAAEVKQLARLLKSVIQRYNQVLQMEFPYIMVHHQCAAGAGQTPHYHWHIEFYPPYRAAGKLKFLAGVESGTGFFINDTVPEQKAAELRSYQVDAEV